MVLFRFSKYLLIIVILFISLKPISNAQEINRTFRVGVYENKPKAYVDEKGKAVGIFPDILNFIATQENWNLEYVPGTWEEGLQKLENGEIDIMVDVAISPERLEKYDFPNETLLNSWGIIYVHQDSTINTFDELDGKNIAILKAGIYYGGTEGIDKYLEAFGIQANYIDVLEYADTFELLDRGEVDAAVVSRIFALTNANNYTNIKQTDMFFNPTELRFALTKNSEQNPYLIERLDYWTLKITDGYGNILHDTLEKYELKGAIVKQTVIPQILKIILAILGGIIFITLFIILTLKRAEIIALRKLQEKEALLSNILKHTEIAIFSFTKDGLVTIATGKALERIGIKQNKILDRYIFDQVKNTIQGENIEIQSKIKNRMWRINTASLETGKTIIGLGIAVDLTKEVELDQIKTQFLHLVAHHLRTIPTEIKWGLELLSPKVIKKLPSKDHIIWKNIDNASERMIELANSIARSSQLELERFYTVPEEMNIHKIIEESLEKLKDLIKDKKIKVIKNYKETKSIVQDKNHIKMILHTLLSNAIRYNQEGGIVNITVETDKDNITIKVADTGYGIPREEQDKIFTKMFRAKNVEKRDVQGLGLELFTIKIIVEKLKGKIWFESEENKGSTFYVELPQKRI